MTAVFETPTAEPRAAGEHAVRFYDQEERLLDEIAEFLDGALRAGGYALAIATAPHRAELKRRLNGLGGPATERLGGRLIMLDAAQTLDAFMVAGHPDAGRFESCLVPLIEKVPPGEPLHAFGEMVAVLCDGGQYEAALALEALWNALVRKYGFSLFCAYPRRLFASAEHSRAFQHVCAAHTSVLDAGDEDTSEAEAPAHAIVRLRHRTVALQLEVQRRRQAEQALRQRERELADFLENASEGIHKVAADGTILYANRAELQMLGYPWEEYVGRNIAQFYIEQDRIEQILTRLKRGEVLRDEPAVLRCRDGTRKHVLISSNGCFENGELIHTRCFTRDASERIARDQAMEQRNNFILHAPVGAALITGQDLRFELANGAFCSMLGRTRVEGRAFSEVFPELADSQAEHLIREVLRTGQPFASDEYRALLRFEGSELQERFYKLSLQPLANPGGAVASVIAVAVDVTEQVRARRALEEAADEREQLLRGLRNASRAKDEFLAMLGHELRNPLSPIVTALQLMRMRGDTATAREQAIIQRQVDHLVGLVDDLLDIARITRGKIELKRGINELSAVLSKAVEQASLLLEQRNHHLHIDVEPGLQCECDPVRIAQVVSNLLTNAARYTNPGGVIHLHASRADAAAVVISVRDNGNGISAELLPRVFDLFFQGERGIDRSEGGLGIGLALVKNLVELHGGTVEATSAGKGCGSEFRVYLPTPAAQPAGAGAARTEAGYHAAAGGKRILLVDDNVDAAETMGEWLRLSGHEVAVFTDPVSALCALPGFQPEVAVLDIGLPVMSGYELAAKVREACGASCTLVALSGYGQDADKEKTRAAGFHRHLVKPVLAEQLLELFKQP